MTEKHCEILVQSYPPNEPVVAEANAILWAIQIAKEEDFKHIIVEGDAKICFDVLNGNVVESLWSISSLCRDIKFLGQSFTSKVIVLLVYGFV